MPARVCVVGSINMDLVVRCARLPAPGETLIGAAFEQHPGGKGANQAVAARRLGADVGLIGAIGDDANGEFMLEALAREHIDLAHVASRQGLATGVALITTDSAGENTIVVASGANASVSAAQVHASADAVRASAVTLAVLEVPIDAVSAAADIASAAGGRFVLNAAPAMHLPPELLRGVSVLVCNQVEAAVLSDHTGADVGTVARALLAMGPQAVIITLGAGGALLDDRLRGMRRIPALAVQPIDTVGAGDCFCGALAAALAGGQSLDDSAAFACVAASLATTRAGAIPGMPSLPEVRSAQQSLP